MYEIIRWVSLILLWFCLGVNIWSFIRTHKAYKGLKTSCAELRKLISLYEGRPPVVYCYECEYYDKVTVNDKGFVICPASGMDITAHDYCSFAEQKKTQDLTSDETN